MPIQIVAVCGVSSRSARRPGNDVALSADDRVRIASGFGRVNKRDSTPRTLVAGQSPKHLPRVIRD